MSDILFTSDVIKEAQQNGYTGIIIPEEYDQTAVPFRPVKCTEAALQVTEPVEGYVYFTTDTKKIYYGHDGKFLGMGGNSGFYYGNKTIQDTELDYIVITVDELDGDVLPNVDDLIINVGGNQYDGFYRVVEQVSDYEVHVVQLPVGGGGGGGGSGSTSGRVTVRRITPGQQTIIAGRELTIEYTVDAVDVNGDPVVVPGRAIWRVNNVVVAQESNVLPGDRSFRISDYLDLTKETNTVGLVVLMDTGGSYDSQGTASWSVSVINLNFEWNVDYVNNPYITGQNFTLSWTVRGIPRNMQAGERVLTHILFDNNYTENTGYFTQEVSRDQQGVPIQRVFQSLPYGVHDVEMWVTATVGGLSIETDHQFNKLIFTADGSSVLIAIPFFQKDATRYDTLQIPFLIYQPGEVSVFAEWLVNGQVVSSGNYDSTLHYWIHTLSQDGQVTLSIRCGSVEASVTLNVAPLDLPVAEPIDYNFALKPKLLDGNEALQRWSENGVNLTFSDNFDWDNGGIKNIDGTTCIVVKHNTTMTINYRLFQNRAETNGKLLKFVFKASNCYDYAAQVLSCYNNGIGLQVTAQQAVLSGSTISVSTNYYEDSYIELEADIWKTDSSDVGERYMMLWVDGVPTAVRVYPQTGSNFTQQSPQYITIGSPDCDVYVYLVKEYERTLTKEEHLNNFIVDAPTTAELIERYNRNDILDTTGEISPYRLAERNPNCQVHLYEISRMTTSKNDKVNNCHYEQYVADPNKPVLTADNVTIKVQGTSSAYYGVAAYNIDSEFKDGFVDMDGNQTEGWAMSENSIPVNYFCTKVNVASSENANNAINADVYNELQPYHDAHRRKNPKARDCMEFHPGVMFVKDNNKVTNDLTTYGNNNVFYDTTGYVNNPYYKQYAICNMGNSKKNINVFHDTENEKCCCIEVLDNQQAQQQMTSAEGVTPECFDNDSDWYEFRYPDGNEEASQEMKQAWCDFVKWMVDNNPANATGTPLEEHYIGKSYTFGTSAHPNAVYSGTSNATLNGFTETTYANVEFTHDTKEYRVAKMLEECEDHLVMDSVVFHYLFIERHTMVDNVAKNTFWSTEDLQHWDLTKNYDNDTSDGNDNSGMLTFTYGIECMDKRPGSVDESAKAFNAAESAWLNFVDGLPLARKHMYEGLTANADSPWRATNYLSRMQNFQDVIPERCWIEDYFRKYLRPRRIGQDSGGTYIERLEGGKKTHQRAQYENYQEFYLDSKYRAGTARDSYINIRAQKTPQDELENLTDNERHLDVSMYIDSYFWASIGQQESGGVAEEKLARLKRGEKLSVQIPNVDTLSDATTYLYGAKYLQTLERSAILFPETYDAGSAMKLRTLDLGSIDGKFKNPYLRSLTLPSSYLLENFNAQDVKGPTEEGQVENNAFQNLELQSYTSLKDVNISGSSVRSISFAPDGLLENAKLSALKSLTMIGLSKLKSVTFDDGIEDSLETLHIEDCPKVIDTQDLVTKVNKSRTFSGYRLINVDWTITENSLGGSGNRQLTTIDILEKFTPNEVQSPEYGWYENKNRPLGYDIFNPNAQATPATCLTGTLTIDMNCDIDEYTLYYKYQTNFPNLEIKYSSKVNLIKAPTITFMENDLDDSPILKQVKTDKKTTVRQLISADGPSGIPMGTPCKASDNLYDYHWNVANAESGNDDKDWKIKGTNDEYTDEEMKNLTPTEDTVFVPIFTQTARSYTVEYRDNDGVTPLTDYFNGGPYSYGRHIHLLLYYYKPHNNPTEKKWTLKGWMDYQEFSKWNINHNYPPQLIQNENDFEVTQNTILYAYFVEEDINAPTRSDLFTTTQGRLSSNILDTDGNRVNYPSVPYKIELDESQKGSYRQFFRDVLVLPKQSPEGQIYYQVGDFSNMPYVPKIMFEEGCSYLELTSLNDESSSIGSFANAQAVGGRVEIVSENPALTEVVLPPSLRHIGNGSFLYQSNLRDINWENVTDIGISAFAGLDNTNYIASLAKTGLPPKLYNLGARAFQYGSADLVVEELPATLSTLNANVLAYCGNRTNRNGINIRRLGSFAEGATELRIVGVYAFAEGGKSIDLTELWVEKNVNPELAQNCLGSFGDNITTVHFGRPEQEYRAACRGIGPEETISHFMGLRHVITEDFEE